MVPTAKRLFTVDEYHRLFEVGILSEQDRVELIDGEIIRMPPIGPWHGDRTDDWTNAFVLRVAGRARASTQTSIQLSDGSEPVPDVALFPPGHRRTMHGHPRPADLWLLVEIADTSAVFDLVTKAGLYAREGVLEYWVVSREDDEVIVHRDSNGERYRDTQHHHRGDYVRPVRLPEVEFTVDELLGPPQPDR